MRESPAAGIAAAAAAGSVTGSIASMASVAASTPFSALRSESQAASARVRDSRTTVGARRMRLLRMAEVQGYDKTVRGRCGDPAMRSARRRPAAPCRSAAGLEVPAQAGPARLVAELAVRGVERLPRGSDDGAGFEHEGHGVADHVGLRQVGRRGLLEGR